MSNIIEEENKETKICNKCGIEKPLSEFEFRSDTKKYRNTCKECRKKYTSKWHKENLEYVKEYLQNNKEHIKARSKRYYDENREKLIEYSREYREENPLKVKEAKKKWREENKTKISNYNKDYEEIHKEERKEYKRNYHKENRKKENEYFKIHNKTRREKDSLYKIKVQLRHLIYHSFERKGYSKKTNTYKIIGTDYTTFYNYLLETFKKNYGYEWDKKEEVHIDHIIPLSEAKTEEEVIRLCHYTNLQLLKAKDNIEKSDKLNWNLEEKEE